MSTDDRSAEFSLQQPSDSDETQSMKDAPVRIDWDQWFNSASVENIPAIPFPPGQVFLPGEVKQLHLYEARYLALFETVVLRYDKRCAHVLIDARRRAMAAFGTVISVRNWKRLNIGVSVHVEAVGRTRTSRFVSSSPFLRGEFQSVQDDSLPEQQLIAVRQLEVRFWQAFRDVVSLSIRIGIDPIRQKIDTATETIQASNETPLSKQSMQFTNDPKQYPVVNGDGIIPVTFDGKEQFFETRLKNAALRAVNFCPVDFVSDITDNEMLARRVEGLSFAGWDYFPSVPAMRQRAIEARNTMARFTTVVENLERYSRRLAAQLALQRAFPT
ncbi:hypothetical protein FGB62_16g237 [Gracilaria domingensis]|nr:hypothetical protein FGB62_16g237 [Gracilaria domingensis]